MKRGLIAHFGRGLIIRGGSLRGPVASGDLTDREAVAFLDLALAALRARRAFPLTIEVARPRLQIRTLDGLPSLAAAQLRRLVSINALRFFRGRASLRTDAAWMRLPGPGRRAIAVAAPAAFLEEVCGVASGRGYGIAAVRPAGEHPWLRRLSLLPMSLEAEVARTRKRSGWLTGGVAAVSFAGALGLGGWRVQEARRATAAELSRIMPRADSALKLRRSIRDMLEARGALREERVARGKVLAVVAGLAGRLPSSDYLVGLRLEEEGSLMIEGMSADPGVLLRELRREPHLSRVALIEPPVERLLVGGLPLAKVRIAAEWHGR